MGLDRSSLDHLTAPGAFMWAVGIEDTFITAPWPATGRTLDEYELTGHYQRWESDLDLIASLGVKYVRYGIPWHRIQPAPDRWDWALADGPLERLLDHGIDPIVDLVHYGLPSWLDGAYLAADFPQRMADYATRVAERYHGRIRLYTPLNEPRVTAWYCGKLGWWPPYQRGWKGFVAVMRQVCRGICLSMEALRAVDPLIVPMHVDATDLYLSQDPLLATEVARRQELVFLALDLVAGRVGESHPLRAWLADCGLGDDDLAWFRAHAGDLPAIGLNLYPMFTRKVLTRGAGGLRMRMPYASADLIGDLGRLYHRRYDCPLWISETASVGPVRRRKAWLDDSLTAVRDLRAEGVPMVGYTWWPLFALVTWGYRQGTKAPAEYLRQMGLWDLDAGLERVPTPLVDAFRGLVAGGSAAVGERAQTGLEVMS